MESKIRKRETGIFEVVIDGKTVIVFGNTFKIKDELKKEGFRFFYDAKLWYKPELVGDIRQVYREANKIIGSYPRRFEFTREELIFALPFAYKDANHGFTNLAIRKLQNEWM